MIMQDDTLAHPTLKCTLRGSPSKSSTQFRNLKFASIPGRWKDAVLYDSLGTGTGDVFDATMFGPSCPHKRGAQAWDLTLIGNVQLPLQAGHESKEERMNEFECLNVNVTVPKVGNEANGNGLPVFVWVHGGGISVGSISWPQYDLARFVERSVEIGKPVIGVAINYRLGILGYLASQELGIDGNFGYKDQVLGFKWVKKHIAGFGGDPNNITAAGESAGGISLSTLLCVEVGDEGLFERVIIMSGEATLRKPRNKAWHEKMYQDQLKLLKLDHLGVEERTTKLREMDVEEFGQKLPLAQHYCACVDGKFLKKDITLTALGDGDQEKGKPEWCKEFVVGDTAHDGTILKGRIVDNPNNFPLLESLCSKYLTPSETSSLLAAYNLPNTSPSDQISNTLELASELRFYLPILALHNGLKTSKSAPYCRRYHFHASNPVDGSFKGLASHELDVGYLLGNYEVLNEGKGKEVGRQMAERWIGFANGEGLCKEGKVLTVGNEGLDEVEEGEYDETFRSGRGSLLTKIGWGRLWKVADEWQGVRQEEGYASD